MRNTIFAVLLAALLSACASSGTKMDASKTDQLAIGQTTQSDMMQMFGSPLAQSYDDEGRLTLTWHYVHVGPFGTNMQQQNLIAVFSEDGTLARYNMLDGG